MPILPVFPATAQVGHGIHAAKFHPHKVLHREAWREADVETAVAVQQAGMTAITFQPALVGDEHRHACSVIADIKYLARYVVGWVEVHFRFSKYRVFAGFEIEFVDRPRVGEAAK